MFKKQFQLFFIFISMAGLALSGCSKKEDDDNSNNSQVTPVDEQVVSTWSFVDSSGAGINRLATKDATSPKLMAYDSKLYAIWEEYNNLGYSKPSKQIRVSVYNGDNSSPSWSLVDGNQEVGINLSAGYARKPSLTAFDSKLYAIWSERSLDSSFDINEKLYVSVYNGDDDAPNWSVVTGDSWKGINKGWGGVDSSTLTVADSKLYAIWEEPVKDEDVSGDLRRRRIFVSVYNGDDNSPAWKTVDGDDKQGLNYSFYSDGIGPDLYEFNSRLYAVWSERHWASDSTADAPNNVVTRQVRVKVYNGDDLSPAWTFVDGGKNEGLNSNTEKYAYNPRLAAFDSKLYVIWEEKSPGWYYGHVEDSKIHVSVYNGNDDNPKWSPVDNNELNRLSSHNGYNPKLVTHDSKLYAIWHEDSVIDASGDLMGNRLVRVAAYNGNDAAPSWSFVDGNQDNGLNWSPSNYTEKADMVSFDNALYATWSECKKEDSSSDERCHIRVKTGQ